jgi:chorismate dehydratase
MRVSAISYLNTAPLMWGFERGVVGSGFEVTYTVPSKCAIELAGGTADVGLIPAAAYATIPDLSVIPGVAIASKQAVRSILLVSKKPIEEIECVAADNSSLSSTSLLRVLFARFWGGPRSLVPHQPDLDRMLAKYDAALLIGDPALKVDRSRFQTWDLAEEWIRLTGKPFVFAFWAVRNQALKEICVDLAASFQGSRDRGLEPKALDEIAFEWAPKVGLSEEEVRQYLTENIHFYLDGECMEGLNLFYKWAHEYKVLPFVPVLHFADPRPALI